eukprot:jgi/Chrzof1/2433/Cz11g15120.t1_PSAN2
MSQVIVRPFSGPSLLDATLCPRRVSVRCSAQAASRQQPTRRQLLLTIALTSSSPLVAASPAAAKQQPLNQEVDSASSPFIQELLKRTQENRDRRYKERLNDYYKRNFKDYFNFEAGTAAAGRARGLTPETQAAIAKWLQDNK